MLYRIEVLLMSNNESNESHKDHNDLTPTAPPAVPPTAPPSNISLNLSLPKTNSKLILTLLLVLGIIIAIIVAWVLIIRPLTTPAEPAAVEVVTIVDENRNVLLRSTIFEAIIEQSREVQKLQVYEITLSDMMEINDSWGFFGSWSDKTQEVRIPTLATYTVDLSIISEADIVFDFDTNRLAIAIPRPILDPNPVMIDPDQVEIGSVESGWLRSNDLEISADEFNELLKRVQDELTQKALGEQANADVAAVSAVRNMYNKVLSAVISDDYRIDIFFR